MISQMNSEPERNTPGDLASVLLPEDSAQEEALGALQAENQRLKDSVLEERFCWIVVCIILFNTTIFANVQTTGVPFAILFLQLLLILVLARKFGVEQITRFIDRLIDGWSRGQRPPTASD
jgi:hypothetical protein